MEVIKWKIEFLVLEDVTFYKFVGNIWAACDIFHFPVGVWNTNKEWKIPQIPPPRVLQTVINLISHNNYVMAHRFYKISVYSSACPFILNSCYCSFLALHQVAAIWGRPCIQNTLYLLSKEQRIYFQKTVVFAFCAKSKVQLPATTRIIPFVKQVYFEII